MNREECIQYILNNSADFSKAELQVLSIEQLVVLKVQIELRIPAK